MCMCKYMQNLESEKMGFCCLSSPVCDLLLQYLYQTNTTHLVEDMIIWNR